MSHVRQGVYGRVDYTATRPLRPMHKGPCESPFVGSEMHCTINIELLWEVRGPRGPPSDLSLVTPETSVENLRLKSLGGWSFRRDPTSGGGGEVLVFDGLLVGHRPPTSSLPYESLETRRVVVVPPSQSHTYGVVPGGGPVRVGSLS